MAAWGQVVGLRQGAPRPNNALEPTAYSLRSCLASAFGGGSPRALGVRDTARADPGGEAPPGRRGEIHNHPRRLRPSRCGGAAPRLPRRPRAARARRGWCTTAWGAITGGARAPNMALE